MTTPEQRVEEALAFVKSWDTSYYQDLAQEVYRLRKELSSVMEIYAHEMAKKDAENDKLAIRLGERVAEIAELREKVRVLSVPSDGRCTMCWQRGAHICVGTVPPTSTELNDAKSNTGGA